MFFWILKIWVFPFHSIKRAKHRLFAFKCAILLNSYDNYLLAEISIPCFTYHSLKKTRDFHHDPVIFTVPVLPSNRVWPLNYQEGPQSDIVLSAVCNPLLFHRPEPALA